VSDDPGQTHYVGCWRWHDACADDRMLRIASVLDQWMPDGPASRQLLKQIASIIGAAETTEAAAGKQAGDV